MTATIQGHWPAVLGHKPKHFRVVAGPVRRVTTCSSARELREKIPEASEEMQRLADAFFRDRNAVLEVVPV